jgi:energy-converting hydrogenase Eha subunit B
MVSRLDRATRACGGVTAGAFAVGLLTSCSGESGSGGGSVGSFTLKGGETREIFASAVYYPLRVCNYADSAGAITATIDDNIQHELAPGVCARDLGGSVLLHNLSSGEAHGDYRTSIGIPAGRR